MSFEDRLSNIIAGESAIGRNIDSIGGEKLDFGVNVGGNKYELFLVEDNYVLARNGIIEHWCHGDAIIEDLSSLIKRDWNHIRGKK